VPKNINWRLANNPWLTGLKTDPSKGVRGGPLPCGKYSLKVNPNRKSKKNPNQVITWIDLIPDSSNFMANRADFAIHGHGEEGSNGCIVPVNPLDLQKLYEAVSKAPGETLSVVAGDLSNTA
jgi:hypothetical protein